MNNWKDYETYIIKYHQDTYNHITYHWSNIPEEILYESGFINDTNKMRLQRKKDKIEGKINSIQEYGLDGIAKDNEIYHGLQAKCYDGKSYLKASDLGTFLSILFLRMKAKNKESKGYLYHTCKLESNLYDDIFVNNHKDIIQTKLLLNNNIQEEYIKSTNYEKEILRYYQKEAIEKLKNSVWNGKQLIQMPCGTGKSTVIAHYLEDCDYEHIYIFSPLRIHAKQNLENMGKYLMDYEKILVDCDKDGTRNIEYIKDKLNKKVFISSTYKSALDIIHEITKDKKLLNKKNIVIVDEAHNIYPDLGNILEKFNKVILLTATPSEEMKEIIDCETLYKYNMDKAIEDKYICDYRIYLPYLENDYEVPIEFNEYNKELVPKVMYLINGMLTKGCRRSIVYLKSIEECEVFNDIVKEVMEKYHYLPYWSERINKDISDKERVRILQEFESEKERSDTIHILSSVRILDEGVDIVKCDSVFICGGNGSGNEIRTLQRMCRANRLDKKNINKIAHCFMWCNEWNESLVLLNNVKELDSEFNKKVSIMGIDYNNNCNKIVKEKLKYESDKIKEYIKIKCMNVGDKQMERAIQIVKRAKKREQEGKNLLPKSYSNWKSKSEEIIQEHRDNQVIEDWRKCIKNKCDFTLSNDVKLYLDKELPTWSNLINYEEEAYKEALEIVKRLKVDKNGNKLHPKNYYNSTIPEEIQETKDYQKLEYWSRALRKDELNSTQNRAVCHLKVKELLDKELPNWNVVESTEESHIKRCKELIENCKKRVEKGLHVYPKKIHYNEIDKNHISIEEYNNKKSECDDYNWINKWRKAYINLQKGITYNTLSTGKKEYYICPDEVVEMLNEYISNWNIENKDELEELEKVEKIVERCYKREKEGKTLLPKFKNNIPINKRNDEEKKENSDANKISMIKKAYNQHHTGTIKEKERHYTYYQSVIDYLDKHIPNWKEDKKIEENKDKENLQMKGIIELINRCNKRKEKGLNYLPKYRKSIDIKDMTQEELIEYHDAEKLWCLSNGNTYLYENVKKYLDENLEDWNKERIEKKDFSKPKVAKKVSKETLNKMEITLLNDVKDIIQRCVNRENIGLNKYPKSSRYNKKYKNESDEEYEKRILEEKQQEKDYDKLLRIKNNKLIVYDSVTEYLDIHLPEWKK